MDSRINTRKVQSKSYRLHYKMKCDTIGPNKNRLNFPARKYMNKGRIFLYILIFLAISTNPKTTVYAVDTPTFPKCENPQGTLKVSYDSGTHGVPGNSNTFTGKDAVYNLTEDTLTQCLCTINQDGIQTNWWKVSSLSLDQIEQLQKSGWIHIPNGADWGLDQAPYMAQNTDFDCDKEDKDKDEDDNDDENEDNDDNDPEGEVLGISTRIGGIGGQVLGLASTGNTKTLILVSLGGFLSSLAFVTLLLNKNSKS